MYVCMYNSFVVLKICNPGILFKFLKICKYTNL